MEAISLLSRTEKCGVLASEGCLRLARTFLLLNSGKYFRAFEEQARRSIIGGSQDHLPPWEGEGGGGGSCRTEQRVAVLALRPKHRGGLFARLFRRSRGAYADDDEVQYYPGPGAGWHPYNKQDVWSMAFGYVFNGLGQNGVDQVAVQVSSPDTTLPTWLASHSQRNPSPTLVCARP